MSRNKLIILGVIIIILLVVGGTFLYKNQAKPERQGIIVDTSNAVTPPATETEEYSSLDSSDQVIAEIDESLEFLE